MLSYYTPSLHTYKRLVTREIKVGELAIGGIQPIRIQTMTTTDTMDTEATIAQCVRCIEAGAELVRITAPSKKEAENLLPIKNALRQMGYNTPLVADIHFTPNAAEVAARIIEKVRINPGNYIDKKKFDFIEYTDAEYAAEVERIRHRFTPLVKICKEYGTAMRIGTNHGSLSDRIMSRYGDSPIGMVESAMEFLRIARDENYHQIVLSMKSSNPLVMVQAYRLLVRQMQEEFGECYPLHLGVTEAGDGEDGRIKSAIGIGSLLADGIGDTIRVSLTEDPEFEIPVCKDLVAPYNQALAQRPALLVPEIPKLFYNPFSYNRRKSTAVQNIGDKHVPVVIADFSDAAAIEAGDLQTIGYHYSAALDKWHIADSAADFIFLGRQQLDFEIPGTLKPVVDYKLWAETGDKQYYPYYADIDSFKRNRAEDAAIHFIGLSLEESLQQSTLELLKAHDNCVACIRIDEDNPMQAARYIANTFLQEQINTPVIWRVRSEHKSIDEQLIALSTCAGSMLLDGLGDGLWLNNNPGKTENIQVTGRTYLELKNHHQFLNNTAFSILQATRTRISKTEYISCPSCGRTLFDLQETTAKIRAVTNHLKGVKIAIMGCIVNGPGEMADADFGYVGSGPGKITLYKGKEVVKKNVPAEIAVEELVQLLKDNNAWVETEATV